MRRGRHRAGTVAAMREVVDVVVVGAGPAGISAAITAANHGATVVCLDKAAFGRDKT